MQTQCIGESEESKEVLQILVNTLRRGRKADTVAQRISEGVRECLMEGFTVAEYATAKEGICTYRHQHCEAGCPMMGKAAKIVLDEKCVPLSKL